MERIFGFLFILVTITGCVSQTKYDDLQLESEQLKIDLHKLKSEISELQISFDNLQVSYYDLLAEKRKLEEKKKRSTLYSKTDALKLLKDYYSFYNADRIYRNPRVRKISYNKFRISLEECSKKGSFSENDFFWRASVKLLIIYEDGKYDISSEFL
ncbi:MAG: hypothetical protein K8S00_00020 [Bacteroidales bacterium]|nr:hypothetical protein [Bacteroidales bacterium]